MFPKPFFQPLQSSSKQMLWSSARSQPVTTFQSVSFQQRAGFSATSAASKAKTHKGTAKRWSVIASGKLFKRAKAGKQHLNGLMSTTRLNRLGLPGFADASKATKLRRLLPYYKTQ